MLLPLLAGLQMVGPYAASGSGGRARGRKRPEFWWEATYEELREVPLPVEPKANEVALEVLARIQAIWRDIDARRLHTKRLDAEADRLLALAAKYLESARIDDLLVETKQRIWAAEEAKREALEIEELLVIL